MNQILGSRTSVASLPTEGSLPGACREVATGCKALLALAPWKGGAERSEAGLGATKEVLGSTIAFAFDLDFLGFPLLLL